MSKVKKKKRKAKVRVWVIVLFLIVIVGLGIFFSMKFFSKKETEVPKVVDSIESYGYTLEDRDTDLMKTTYKELKDILNEKEINKEEYAKTITKLFIIDLFTMENKRNKYDVGGVEYIYIDHQENYKINVQDTLYKTLQSNNDGKRKQELPEVKDITVGNVVTDDFAIGDSGTFSAYVLDVTWNYVRDLGYDNKATVTCIEKDGKIYVAQYEVGE
ncbi:MAG: hypothetical protein K2M17_01245 [Bacilli bacterium]|nr:hypothetical protein [Bacilli bacterium]